MPAGPGGSWEEFVRKIFLAMYAVAAFAVTLIVITVAVRFGMFLVFYAALVVVVGFAMWLVTDPVAIVALLIAILLVWTRPWETHDPPEDRPRRGSRLDRL